MCIADNSCSISTDVGDFNSTSLSQSVMTSLGPYPWRFKPIRATIIDGPYSSDTAFMTNLDTIMDTSANSPVQPGMEITFPNSTPQGQTSFVQFFDGAEVDTSPAITADTGDIAVFSRPKGLVSCSIFDIAENVQTKDRKNDCVDFLQLFVSSGSDQGLPTTHIFTDDGFDFTVTATQKLLQWQGGWTNQNGFVPANQLGIGSKLVSWANNIYQYVQISSMSFEKNNAIGVNFLTTGTNSYQLTNGVVVRGQLTDYCSCMPSASINDFPCGYTASYCFSSSLYSPLRLYFSGSESGNGADGGGGSTVKSWSPFYFGSEGQLWALHSQSQFPTNSTTQPTSQFVTASFLRMTQSQQLDLCYTETRYLGPIQTRGRQFAQASFLTTDIDGNPFFSGSDEASAGFPTGLTSGSVSSSQGNSLNAYVLAGTPGVTWQIGMNYAASGGGTGPTQWHIFTYFTGSHEDLLAEKKHVHHIGAGGINQYFVLHTFASNSAGYEQGLSQSHPSYSNAGYSLAYKINSASKELNMHRYMPGPSFNGGFTWQYGPNPHKGMKGWPSASYGRKPKNIRTTTSDPDLFGLAMDYHEKFKGDTIYMVSSDTGSQCTAASPMSVYANYGNFAVNRSAWSTIETMSRATNGRSFLEWLANPSAVSNPTWYSTPGECESTSSLGLEASDTCCIQLNISRKPSASFANPACQDSFGSVIDLQSQFTIYNADQIVWSTGTNTDGTFSNFVNDMTTATRFTMDATTHARGKAQLCYTASAFNPDCTDNADELPHNPGTSTPNCCPAISGCVEVYLHPGHFAGKDQVQCWPTMSLEGVGPIYNFTDTDVSQPTWSLEGAITQNSDYELNPIIEESDVDEIWTNTITFGAIANLTNSYQTEIHMNPSHENDDNFGWFTMSLEVSNGPCVFKDTAIQYVAKTIANAGPDRMVCIGDGNNNQFPFLPTGSNSFIQLQATGTGIWEVVSPIPQIGVHPTVVTPTSPTSEVRIAHCEPVVTLRWRHISSSTVKLSGPEDYSITCEDTDTVRIAKFKKQSPFRILGHSIGVYTGDIVYEPAISVSAAGIYGISNASGIGDSFGRSNQDTVYDIHQFGEPPFSTSIFYKSNNTVKSDEISFQLPRPLATFPMHVPDTDLTRMFKWKDPIGNHHGISLAASESNGGIFSQSKQYQPFGINDPADSYFTSSVIYFSSSISSSYAAASGSPFNSPSGFLNTNKHFYGFGISGSMSDCNCGIPAGTQGRLFYHLEPATFFLATQSGFLYDRGTIIEGSPLGAGGLGSPGFQTIQEPSLGMEVPVYRDVFALNFVSESVVKGFTGSSVIYNHETTKNMPAPYISTSLYSTGIPGTPKHRQPRNSPNHIGDAGIGKKFRPCYPPSKWTTNVGFVNEFYPNDFKRAGEVDAFGTLIKNFTSEQQLIENFPYRSGLNYTGYGVNIKWKARELYVYNEDGVVLEHGTDIPTDIITGSFGDTMTSESYVEAPIFFPAQRAYSQSIGNGSIYNGFASSEIRGGFYIDGFESGGDKRHVPYYSPVVGNTDYEDVISQSVMFEVTASVNTDHGVNLKNYYASMSVMFILTETRT